MKSYYLIFLIIFISCGMDSETENLNSEPGSSITLDPAKVYSSNDVFNECATIVPDWDAGQDNYNLLTQCSDNKENAVRALMISGDSQLVANDKVYKEIRSMRNDGTYSQNELIEYDRYLSLYYWEM